MSKSCVYFTKSALGLVNLEQFYSGFKKGDEGLTQSYPRPGVERGDEGEIMNSFLPSDN